MSNSNLLRSACYCLLTALLLTVATSGNTFAAPPEVPPGLADKNPPGVPPGQAKKSVLQIESMGARAFGGKNLPMPTDPTDFHACDHGYVEWFIPPGTHKRPLVFTHGSSARSYQTTFDGQPGFASIFLGQQFPVYLVDFPWTGRAGMACEQYTWDPNNVGFSARTVFNNRVGVWPPNTPEAQKQFFPGVAFSHDPRVLDQYYRNQYVENNTPHNEDVETDALAVLLEQLYAEQNIKAVVFTHSSGNTRGWLTALKTDKVGGIVAFESCSMFPEGEVPPPIPLAGGGTFPYTGRIVPLPEFLKLTKFPILVVFGDNIPRDPAKLDVRGALRTRCLLWRDTVNKHGGNAQVLDLPDVGILGNTHYVFADTNVNQVAAQMSLWLKNQGLDN
jgi:pimeloyl-ACP methyl ester carboxylesterase